MVQLCTNNNAIWDKVGIPPRGKALHSAIEHGFSYDVLLQIIEYTGIDKKELAECLSISISTLHRRAKSCQFTSRDSDKLYRFINVLVEATALFECNQYQAISWLQSNIAGLGGKRPIDMLSSSAGYNAVRDIIGRLEHGVFP